MLQKLEGYFLRWQRSRSGKLQSIQIQTSTLVQSVRVGKKLRPLLFNLLTPQVPISLLVKTKKSRMIAKFVVLMPHDELTVSSTAIPKPIEVKVCTSKHCCKAGSKNIASALEQLQLDGNIGIQVKTVGCLGSCSQAPAIKIEGKRHLHISPQSAVNIVKKIWNKTKPSSAPRSVESYSNT
jgi:(2Fe-2S) ferredoxin